MYVVMVLFGVMLSDIMLLYGMQPDEDPIVGALGDDFERLSLIGKRRKERANLAEGDVAYIADSPTPASSAGNTASAQSPNAQSPSARVSSSDSRTLFGRGLSWLRGRLSSDRNGDETPLLPAAVAETRMHRDPNASLQDDFEQSFFGEGRPRIPSAARPIPLPLIEHVNFINNNIRVASVVQLTPDLVTTVHDRLGVRKIFSFVSKFNHKQNEATRRDLAEQMAELIGRLDASAENMTKALALQEHIKKLKAVNESWLAIKSNCDDSGITYETVMLALPADADDELQMNNVVDFIDELIAQIKEITGQRSGVLMVTGDTHVSSANAAVVKICWLVSEGVDLAQAMDQVEQEDLDPMRQHIISLFVERYRVKHANRLSRVIHHGRRGLQ